MKKRITLILLALVLCLSLLPTSVLADAPTDYPFVPSIGTVTECIVDGYAYDSDWNGTPDATVPLYTVTVPYGTQELTLTFSEERIAYGYNSAGIYLNSCAAVATNGYADEGKTGERTATVRLVNDKFADFIRVQTPYDGEWNSTTLYAVTFEYTYTFTAAVNRRPVNDADIAFAAGAYPYTPWGGEPTSVPVFTVTVPQGTGTVHLEISDNALLYNYGDPDNYISGFYDDPFTGGKTADVPVDADGSGTPDFIQVQKPYNSDYSGGELLYVITFDDGTTGGSAGGGTFAPTVDALLAGISASYTDSSSEWVVMDMAAYAKTRPGAASKSSAAAIQTYINSAIASLQAESLTDTACDKAIISLTGIGADVTKLYSINCNTPISAVSLLNGVKQSASAWSAPYTLAAYAQGDYDADTYVDALLTAVLANQEENGSWDEFGTIDTTGNVIAALAFYRDQDGVQIAIDKAVAYLSGQQKDSGVFDDGQTGTWAAGNNANSTAMVIIGLAANGINPAADLRFIKDGHSVLDGLLSFALSDGSGFGYANNSAKNDGATEQGFRALIAAAQVIATGEAYNVYDFSDIAVSPVRAAGSGSAQEPAGSTGDNITVSVTIKSDTDYWMNNKRITIPGTGATVYHAFVAALENSGISQTGAANGYVRSMTKNGKTLDEFTNGENSGWLYRVEGKDFPTVGLTSFSIENGDSIIWYYTNDWTTDSYAGGMTAKEQEKQPEIPFVDVPENGYYADAVAWAAENKITDGVSETHFAPDAPCTRAQVVTFLWRAAGCPKAQGAVCRFADVKTDTYYSDAVLWAVENGITNGVSETAFAPDDTVTRAQVVTFLCRFAKAGGSEQSDFADVNENDYFAKSVGWAVENGITYGTSETTFSPDDDCVRAQVVTFLYRWFIK